MFGPNIGKMLATNVGPGLILLPLGYPQYLHNIGSQSWLLAKYWATKEFMSDQQYLFYHNQCKLAISHQSFAYNFTVYDQLNEKKNI